MAILLNLGFKTIQHIHLFIFYMHCLCVVKTLVNQFITCELNQVLNRRQPPSSDR